jgi:hypothetical protein
LKSENKSIGIKRGSGQILTFPISVNRDLGQCLRLPTHEVSMGHNYGRESKRVCNKCDKPSFPHEIDGRLQELAA